MTIQQLEYILAVDQFRHFARAAEYCRVTQPTLSAMIQKLEDELGVKLFDRTVQPVCPTAIGQKVIDQARVILAQAAQVKEIISEDKQSLSGVFRLGVLPTIAPYLLPRFFPQLMEKYPELDIRVTDSVLKAISEPKTDPNTPMMEIDWIRFYTNSTYSDEGVTYWANAGQLFY